MRRPSLLLFAAWLPAPPNHHTHTLPQHTHRSQRVLEVAREKELAASQLPESATSSGGISSPVNGSDEVPLDLSGLLPSSSPAAP